MYFHTSIFRYGVLEIALFYIHYSFYIIFLSKKIVVLLTWIRSNDVTSRDQENVYNLYVINSKKRFYS